MSSAAGYDPFEYGALPPAPRQKPKLTSFSHWEWRFAQTVVGRVPALRRALPLYTKIASAYDGAEVAGFAEIIDMPRPDLCREFRAQSAFAIDARIVRRASLLTLRGKTVLGNTGRIIDEEAETLLRFMGGRDHVGRNDFQLRRLRLAEKPDGLWFNSLGPNRGHRHLYHFMLERMAEFYYLLERLDRPQTEIRVLVRPEMPDYQRRVLEALGEAYPFLRFVPVPPDERWRLPALLCVDIAQNALPAFADPGLLDFIRRICLRAFGVGEKPQAQRRIFISREDTRLRRFTNPDEVHAVLARHGFETVLAARLSFREQIETFRDAAVIAGTHGAGLTNLIFTPPEVPLLEFFPANRMKPTYLELSLAQGRPYSWLRGSPGGRHERFRLDPEELDGTLGALLASPPGSGPGRLKRD